MMSTLPSPADSPIHVEPLHNPEHAAHVVVPQAPLGNATNGPFSQVQGMGAKALLAKKMAKVTNPKYISPTDNMMTPCTQKISNAKKKRFHKGVKSMGQLDFKAEPLEEVPSSSDDENKEPEAIAKSETTPAMAVDDEENPF